MLKKTIMIFIIIIISDSNDDHYNDCVINDRSVPRVTCLGATTFNKNYAFIKKSTSLPTP